MGGEIGMASAADESEHIVMCDLFHEPDTARAENTAFIIERNPWTELDTFRFFDFFLQKSGA